jgi:hypothetical protein
MEDIALTYNFHTTHGTTSLCKIGFVCLLDYFAFLMFIYMSSMPGYDFIDALLNLMGGSGRNDGGNDVAS